MMWSRTIVSRTELSRRGSGASLIFWVLVAIAVRLVMYEINARTGRKDSLLEQQILNRIAYFLK